MNLDEGTPRLVLVEAIADPAALPLAVGIRALLAQAFDADVNLRTVLLASCFWLRTPRLNCVKKPRPRPSAYGRMYGMEKTTVYLPAELKTALRSMARDTGTSEAELIRQAVREKLLRHPRPRPRVPLTGRGLGDPEAADRADELLAGLGRQ